MSFLLLPREKTFLRTEDHCLDVATSTDRVKLLEKFLSKRYTLIAESGTSGEGQDLQNQHCQLELKTTKKKMVTSQNYQLGKKGTKTQAETKEVTDVSVASLMFAKGIPGNLDLEGKTLYVECRGGGASGIYQLVFSYSEKDKARVSTHLSVRRDENISIAQVTNDLNEKNKVLGLSDLQMTDSKGQENISYELKIK